MSGFAGRQPSGRRGREPEQPRPWETSADLDSRAADLAARVAMLVSGSTELHRPDNRHDAETTNLSAYLGQPGERPPGHHGAGGEWDGRSRAEAVRRTATRLAGNAARERGTPPPHRSDDELGAPTGGNHRR